MPKRLILPLFVVAVLLCPLAAQAQYHRHHDFDQWFATHHDVAVEVQVHPYLLQDQAYLTRHPDLRDYLRHHPNYVQEYVATPYPFIEPAGHHEHQHWHQYPDRHWGY